MNYPSLVILSFLACFSCSEENSGIRENPFGEEGKSVIKASYTSNADTVFLSWKLTEEVEFDSYKVSDAHGKNQITLDKSQNSCILTHIPYNSQQSINISLYSGAERVITNSVAVHIPGYDSYIAAKIMPDYGSVTEGDGMYSIYLGDNRSIFLMGDSYTGVVASGKRVSGNHMYRNTYSIYNHKDQSSFALTEAKGKGSSAAVPEGVTDEGKRWYWPGHGFVVGNHLYIFQFLMYSGDGPDGWNFHYEKTDLLKYDLPDVNLENVSIANIPYTGQKPVAGDYPEVHFGAAALNDLASSGYLYIYAQVDIENGLDAKTRTYVARTTEERIYSDWEYFDGKGWSGDQGKIQAMQGVDSVPVSSQFNVFKLGKKYVLLAQNKLLFSGDIYTYISDSPCGPWVNKKKVYSVPELPQSNWYSYNAMAHPQFEKDGMILISFNLNTDNFSEQSSKVESYRPKFVWIEKSMILE